jgi:uncharacterized protein (TIGR02599 family)
MSPSRTYCPRLADLEKSWHTKRQLAGFTLVELMVSVTVLVILMLVVSNFVGLVQRTWVRTNSNVSQFREARTAFDILTRTLSQATLNTYWHSPTLTTTFTDVIGETSNTANSYVRQSELQFISGPTVGGANALFASGAPQDYPGHGVFFQAPLGITNLVPNTTGGTVVANTQNMVNLLCGRGYFVAWGDDQNFRPAFLNQKGLPPRFRLRLMEFSPTAEKNRIYDAAIRPVTDAANQKMWFRSPDPGGQDARNLTAQQSETAATRAFTRPVAENILTLILSPQMESAGSNLLPYRIAPNYEYDSVLLNNVGNEFGTQGTQHLLPPLIKVTMVALDARGGETLSFDDDLRNGLLGEISGLFKSASSYDNDLRNTLESALQQRKLSYRIFTSTIPLKQSRWGK